MFLAKGEYKMPLDRASLSEFCPQAVSVCDHPDINCDCSRCSHREEAENNKKLGIRPGLDRKKEGI